MKKLLITLCIYAFIPTVFGQGISVKMAANNPSPRDSATRSKLLSSLNGLLNCEGIENNPFVVSEYALETSILLDEMHNLGYSGKYHDSSFYKCSVINYSKLSDSTGIVQLSFASSIHDTTLLRGVFTLSAQQTPQQFLFYVPLKEQTQLWRKTQLDNVTIYYKKDFNKKNAKLYFQTIARYDAKLKVPKATMMYYCCDHFTEALKLSGIDYKSDYAGYARNGLSVKIGTRQLTVNGAYTANFNAFDPHDLWHARLHNVVSTTIINRPVDEGTAYLYGGSWGLTWEEILQRFKTYAAAHPDANWLALYNESKNFDDKAKFPLNVDFAINALLVQKIENTKGFPAVLELVSCGNKQENNLNYFTALEKITGIQQEQFNTAVWELIRTN
ncbi:MAG: hypothetical protein V4651_00675 [Bacteroidota bacterium]